MVEQHETPSRRQWLLLIGLPIVGLAAGAGLTMLLDLGQAPYGNLIVNLVFLAVVLSLLPVIGLTRRQLGLQVIPGKVVLHVALALAVFALYILFYLLVIRISALKPWTAAIAWGLLANLVVVLAEELYFRGLLYGFLEQRYSARTALVASSLLFGLFHARQGLSGLIARTFTGWLWGSVRYATGMIFLLMFPVHYAYNSVWLLFVGNWDNPPAWAAYALPAVEFLFGLAIVVLHNRRAGAKEPESQALLEP